ncbi:hypothetical protein WT98_04280 [Burkholderia territorii]|nr:hypothetical protein WT98_04280 [Burkholderia territorii]
MKSASPHGCGGRRLLLSDTLGHLGSSFVRKREKQNAAWVYVICQKLFDTRHKSLRLAGTGACLEKIRVSTVTSCQLLSVIERALFVLRSFENSYRQKKGVQELLSDNFVGRLELHRNSFSRHSLFKIELAQIRPRKQILSCEEIHLDLPSLLTAVVKHAVFAYWGRLGTPSEIHFIRWRRVICVTEQRVTKFMSNQ